MLRKADLIPHLQSGQIIIKLYTVDYNLKIHSLIACIYFHNKNLNSKLLNIYLSLVFLPHNLKILWFLFSQLLAQYYLSFNQVIITIEVSLSGKR